MLGNRRYDPRSGPFVDLLERAGLSTAVWEMSPFGDYNIPRHTRSFLVQPHLIALRAASQVLPQKDDRVELEGFQEFVRRASAAGLRFRHADANRLSRDMLYLSLLADRFSGWLRATRPRLGFVANVGLAEQAFCVACRGLGITSVEVQHGVQGDLHPTYGSWSALPRTGWEVRARVFWCWDEESAAAINRWAAHAPGYHEAIVGGDPWREMWLDSENPITRAAKRLVGERKQLIGGEKHILVTLTSQGEAIPADVLEAVRGSPAGWRYWFRLHPVDQASRAPVARRALLQVNGDPELLDFATEAPLYALLPHMDCHLSVALSTVLREAAAQGLPSVACGVEAAVFYPQEVASGLLLVAAGDGLVPALRQALDRGRRSATLEPPSAPRAMTRLLSGLPRGT
ncbi:MAG: hypothetical protein M3Y38_03605 [Actinomycetota bacterium]|nr:hypothetical protein [Actinomycetota bacterium]